MVCAIILMVVVHPVVMVTVVFDPCYDGGSSLAFVRCVDALYY